jgi:hypothetical protein
VRKINPSITNKTLLRIINVKFSFRTCLSGRASRMRDARRLKRQIEMLLMTFNDGTELLKKVNKRQQKVFKVK